MLGSLVVSPQPQDLHDPLSSEYLVDEAMLDVDPARERAGKVPDEFFKGKSDALHSVRDCTALDCRSYTRACCDDH